MILPVISHIWTSTDSLDLLVWHCSPAYHYGMCSFVLCWTPCYAKWSLCLWICPLGVMCLSQYALRGTVLPLLVSAGCVLCVIALPIFITHTMYAHPLWLALLPSTITPCIHGPPSSLCTAIVDLEGNEIESLCVSLPLEYWSCHNLTAAHFSSSVLKLMGSLLIWGNRALIGLLNRSVAGLGSPVWMGINLICNKARLASLL